MSQFKTWIDEHFRGDPIIWGIVILLSLFSILVVYSATGSLAYKYAGGNTELSISVSSIPGEIKSNFLGIKKSPYF